MVVNCRRVITLIVNMSLQHQSRWVFWETFVVSSNIVPIMADLLILWYCRAKNTMLVPTCQLLQRKKTQLVHWWVNPIHLAYEAEAPKSYSYLINKAELSYPTIRTSGRCPPILVTVTTSGCPMPNAQRSYYLKRVFPIMRNCSSALRDMIIWFNSKPSQVSFT